MRTLNSFWLPDGMQFFFPDSQDQIDPRFDFLQEQSSPHKVRQRDELYAHEALGESPYDGVLLSKAVVDGLGTGGRFTAAHRNRLYRDRMHSFYRLRTQDRELLAMGDCGAFAYVREAVPPYSVDEVIDFYDGCGFDLGFSVDHIVLAFGLDASPDPEWEQRQALTLKLAAEFLDRHTVRKCSFEPIGVAQGWSPESYAAAVAKLQQLGYSRVALGGMVPLKTPEILATLDSVTEVLDPGVQIHLLGVTRVESVPLFLEHGVTSFDSTSPFRQSFMDADDNYYAPTRNYCAVRIPQSDGNAKLRSRIQSGELSQDVARNLESQALLRVRKYAAATGALSTAVRAVCDYEEFVTSKPAREADYEATLEARPWESCGCQVCKDAGVEIIIFRGTERNKRRGFHNLQAFRDQLAQSVLFA